MHTISVNCEQIINQTGATLFRFLVVIARDIPMDLTQESYKCWFNDKFI